MKKFSLRDSIICNTTGKRYKVLFSNSKVFTILGNAVGDIPINMPAELSDRYTLRESVHLEFRVEVTDGSDWGFSI